MHLICCRDIWSSSINIPLMRSGLFSSDHVYLHTCTGGYILCVWCISTYLYRWLYTLCLVHIYIPVQVAIYSVFGAYLHYLYRWLYTLCLVHIYIPVQVAIYSVFGAYLSIITSG